MASEGVEGRGAPTRILFVPVLFYPEPWNGIMEHLQLVIAGLDRARFEPVLATRPDDGTQTATLAARTDVPTVDLDGSRSVGAMRRALRSVRPGIVHIHTPSTSGLSKLALASRLAGAGKVIVTMHQVAPEALPRRSRLVNRAGQRMFIDTTIAVSGGAADTQSEHAGLARNRVQVIHNGVGDVVIDGDALQIQLGEPLPRRNGEVWAGYFGRLAAEKGVDVLIEAVAAARRGGADLRLVVAGEGYERTDLEAQASSLGCGEAVLFTGYRPDARALMREVDIVVHAPRFEGFGLVVAEAMAAGRPVVATEVAGGLPELVDDGVTGLLVRPEDPAALASAMTRLVDDGELRTRLGVAGRARYEEQFSADRMIERTLHHYVS